MVERKCCICGYVPEEGLEDIIQNGTCGMCSKESSADKRKTYKSGEVESKKTSKIILCPSCSQKIRISIPLQGNVLRCTKCKSCFSVLIDNEGYLGILHIAVDSFHSSNNFTHYNNPSPKSVIAQFSNKKAHYFSTKSSFS